MSKKKLRRQIADLTARMEMRERAGANLVGSLDCTDADVRGLADMQEAFKSISMTHTRWLFRLSERVAALENQSDSRGSAGQSADLRSRIADVLKAEDQKPHTCPFDGEPTMAPYDRLADAVIRELGLTQEFSVGDDEGGRTLWFADEEPVIPREGETVEVRWIGPWVPHE